MGCKQDYAGSGWRPLDDALDAMEMRMLGYGVYQVSKEECERCVLDAIEEGYRAMEEACKAGKIRAIGVSNFYPDRFIDLANFCEVVPAVNQVETHVFQQQKVAREVLKKYNTQIESWGPFAEGKSRTRHFSIMPVTSEPYWQGK